MKIKTNLKHRANVQVNINMVLVTFDKNCESEVTESEFELIKEYDDSITVVDEPESEPAHGWIEPSIEIATEVGTVPVVLTPVDSEPEKELVDEGDIEKESEHDIEKLNLSDLKDICSKAGYDKKDWQHLRKDDLITFIKKNA